MVRRARTTALPHNIPRTFYGQLALAKLESAPILRLRDTLATPTAAQLAWYQSRDLTHAIHVLADLGMVSLVRVFATYDVEAHPEPWHVKLLTSDLASMGFTDAAIRASKDGFVQRHIFSRLFAPGDFSAGLFRSGLCAGTGFRACDHQAGNGIRSGRG